jgi:cytochrome c-type biogenesis protein
MINVTIGLAFLAGLASFLSPCVFSLVPAYVGYLSGRSIAAVDYPLGIDNDKTKRWDALTHGLAFVLGFSAVFIFLGLVVSSLGGLIPAARLWLSRIGGIIVVVFGLHMVGILRIPFFAYDLRPKNNLDAGRSYLSSLLMGIFFSAGWSPCVGPTLGGILTLAMNGGSPVRGFQLLAAYSAGLAIPFLFAALGIGWVMVILRRYRKALHYIEMGMGIVLIIVGILLFRGTFEELARFGFFVDLGL